MPTETPPNKIWTRTPSTASKASARTQGHVFDTLLAEDSQARGKIPAAAGAGGRQLFPGSVAAAVSERADHRNPGRLRRLRPSMSPISRRILASVTCCIERDLPIASSSPTLPQIRGKELSH